MFNFPDAPSMGQKYPAAPVAGVPTYAWDGEKWKTPVFYDHLPLRGYISGYQLTWISTTSITVGAGVAADSTNTAMMASASPITKSTSAWAAGNAGGLDTGAFAANKSYHWFAIRNPTTGVVDVLFSLSPTAPTLPSGFTQFRRIASGLTDTATATWRKFVQDGDFFTLDTPVTQSFTNPGTAIFAMALTGVPTGVRLEARVFIGVLANASADQVASVYATQSGLTDLVPNIGNNATLAAYATGFAGTLSIGAMNAIITNTTATIRGRVQLSSANTILYYSTHGWRDNREKD